jgi:hypothetical protein
MKDLLFEKQILHSIQDDIYVQDDMPEGIPR